MWMNYSSGSPLMVVAVTPIARQWTAGCIHGVNASGRRSMHTPVDVLLMLGHAMKER